MSWILEDNKPVRVHWHDNMLVRTRGGEPLDKDVVEVYDNRRQARDARESVDAKIDKIADYLGCVHDLDSIYQVLKPLVYDVERLGGNVREMADALLLIKTDPHAVLLAVRLLVREHGDLVIRRGEAVDEIEALKASLAAVGDERDRLHIELGDARLQIMALELKAEALHCHQVMLAAERASLRKKLEES